MTIDTKNLRALAKTAGTTDWWAVDHLEFANPVFDKADSKFIAACSPDVVLALLDALERKDSLLKRASEALNESYDLVNNEYLNDWRHGLPTRKTQLDGMLAQVKERADVIEAITKEIGT